MLAGAAALGTDSGAGNRQLRTKGGAGRGGREPAINKARMMQGAGGRKGRCPWPFRGGTAGEGLEGARAAPARPLPKAAGGAGVL